MGSNGESLRLLNSNKYLWRGGHLHRDGGTRMIETVSGVHSPNESGELMNDSESPKCPYCGGTKAEVLYVQDIYPPTHESFPGKLEATYTVYRCQCGKTFSDKKTHESR